MTNSADVALVGVSTKIENVRALIRRFAPRNAPCLVTGETGVGKELVARALHTASSRRDAPFVTVNCAALTTSMLSAELFGHVRGSFTGAAHDHAGLFEQADAGTLFLDEIAELPLVGQAALLRVLDPGAEVRRVGGNRVVRVDVRVVAAANRALRTEVVAGRFRADLFHRLDVLEVHVPPLRHRREDVAPLVEHFLHALEREFGRRTIESDALDLLTAHDWPGNVRELRSTIIRAAASTDDQVLTARVVSSALSGSTAPATSSPRQYVRRSALQVTDDAIRTAVEEHRGNVSRAARALGMPRGTVRDRMRRVLDRERIRIAA